MLALFLIRGPWFILSFSCHILPTSRHWHYFHVTLSFLSVCSACGNTCANTFLQPAWHVTSPHRLRECACHLTWDTFIKVFDAASRFTVLFIFAGLFPSIVAGHITACRLSLGGYCHSSPLDLKHESMPCSSSYHFRCFTGFPPFPTSLFADFSIWHTEDWFLDISHYWVEYAISTSSLSLKRMFKIYFLF